MPREAGRTIGARCGGATGSASLPARRPVRAWPAGSVSQCGGGGNAGSRSDHFNCGSAGGARARETARSRRSARPARGGGGAGGGARRAPGCSPGAAARQGLLGSGPAGSLGSRGPACAPPAHRPRFRGGRWAHTPFLGREETLPSQLCDIRLHSRADVCRYKFKNCHWPGASGLFLSPPHTPTPPRRPLTSRKQGSAARPTWVPGCLRGGAVDAWSLSSVSTGVLT